MITVKINGKSLQFEKPDTILTISRNIGIDIPTLCNDHRLVPHGACRLCVVEVSGAKNFPASCSTMITNGMEIYTHSEKIIEARRAILDLILANHTQDCLTCEKAGDCKLQNYCYEYNVKRTTYNGAVRRVETDDTNKFYDVDPEKCILCGKCERVCSELQCNDAISFRDRGFLSCVTRFSDFTDDCVSCGNCVSICPVGALAPKKKIPFRKWEVKSVKTTCVYCGVGCQINLNVKDNKIVGIDPVFELPNDGLLCVKGKFAYDFVNHPDRLTKPLVKENGTFKEISWEEAYKLIVDKITEVKVKYGADALAGLSSARCTNEENYLFQKLFRAVISTNNVDHCARLCHASTVAGLAITLGSGAMTNSIEEVLNCELIFVTGSNTTETHPVIGSKIKQALLRGAKLIVAEPRKIDLANDADVFLQIRPGTNVALFNGMMNVILEEGLQDEEYIAQKTENFEELKKEIIKYTPAKVAAICGIDAQDLINAARLYAKADKAAIFYSMGVTQHSTGTEGVMSISNLALLCGNIGKESSGVNPLRGQNNVQGACDMGALPNVFPGYQKVVDDNIIDKFKKAWNVDKLPNKTGLTVTEIIKSAGKGDIKFLYIMGENPMLSDPDTNHVQKALEDLNFLVVQDLFLTETAKFADLVLPASSFAEKDGTYTNTERKVQRVRKAIEPLGESKSDWEIISEIMNKLGYPSSYKNASEIMDEIASVTPQYGGITYERIEKEGLHWPCPTKTSPGTKILHKDGCVRGKGLFRPAEYKESSELPDNEYPLLLTTGRILYHYHTRTMTGRVDGLNAIVNESYIEINSETAKKLNIKNGEKVKVISRRGEITSNAKIINTIKNDVLFMPFHFADGAANMLTNPALDPIAKIPEFKVCAVRVEKK